jgi:hypothetical protein
MKTINYLMAMLCTFASIHSHGQCITQPMPKQKYEALKSSVALTEQYGLNRGGGTLRNVSLNINILVYGSIPITNEGFIQQQIDTVNTYFANAGIAFSICNVNYIPNNSPFPFWDYQYEYQLGQIYDLPGCINIYYVNFVVNASAYAYYPMAGNPDRIVMGQNLSGEVLTHELGHSFYLIHTHGNYNGGNGTDELVDGTNCITAADLICDTPADPNLGMQGRVDSLCNYIDTVTTDSTGMLYTPDPNNIMSYTSFKCYNRLSTGQYNRIAYTMAHERAYLKSGAQLSAVITAPSSMCVYDTPVTLQANPVGGTFTGSGITGAVFDPAAAGQGVHILSYNLPGQALNTETTDQYYVYSDTVFTTTSAWQSFTASADLTLLAFSFNIKSAAAQNVTVTVYDSIGVTGAVLLQETMTVASDSVFNWQRFQFQNAIHLNAGKRYAMEITALNAVEFMGNSNNVYQNGTSSLTNDLSFVTHVLMDVPYCGNAKTFLIYVSAPPKPVITNLYPVYCIEAPSQPINVVPSGGTLTIDGFTETSIDPLALGIGTHQLYYAYTDAYGCATDSTFTFIINDTVHIQNMPTSLCSYDAAVVVTGAPAGGNLYLDNVWFPTGVIDPALLSNGQHTVSYAYDASYVWVDTVDQNNYFSASNSSYSLSNNQRLWQSFTADIKGYLNAIDFGLYVNSTSLSPYKLFKGEGTTGQLLYADTIVVSNTSSYDNTYPFPSLQLLLEKDSVYTLELGLDPMINNVIPLNDSVYLRGKANLALFGLPNWDFKFRTHVNSVYQCGADSMVETFVVSQVPVINLGGSFTAATGQPVTLDAGVSGYSYLWSTGDTTQAITISGPAGVQTIWVVVTDLFGCSVTDTVVGNFITGIDELNDVIAVLPNPVQDVVTVLSTVPVKQLQLTNTIGQTVLQEEYRNKTGGASLNVSTVPAGVYFLKVTVGNKLVMKRILIEN